LAHARGGIDAYARAGDLAWAKDLLDRLRAEAEALDQAWTWAAFERGWGTWLAATGETAQAVRPLETAVAGFDRLGCRPDAGRAALELGRALLRAGRRTAAADALIDARDRFASMGAGHWVARAEEELDRAAPGRSVGTLPDVELRVAHLVAMGRKNREVAAELYMSVASVEAHLTRMYRKLAIRSRSDLARIVAKGTIAPDHPSRGGLEP
jgi:DNA-binding NarL/FixJ family response regulator